MSQSLYSEMNAMMTNVGVSVVCPGMVATNIHKSWRNRPAGDTPWSDREFADAQSRAVSDDFQGRGISPEAIAESTYQAILEDRFYVFTGERWPRFLDVTIGRTLRGENPAIATWGEDRRPEAARGSLVNAAV